MKLINLLTTLIITLASSDVFAQTFVCENWVFESSTFKEVLDGTMFVGERRKDTFIIVNDLKQKVTLTYLGKKFFKRDYYTTTFDFKGTTYTNVYIVTEGWFKIISAGKWVDYDLVFADDSHTTYCNYQ